MIRVLLADDHAVVRDGLRALLEAQPGIDVVADVANGREAVRQSQKLRPDVVVMDIAMPDLNGIEATLQMQDACPSTQILILSMHSTTEHIFRALQAGGIRMRALEVIQPELHIEFARVILDQRQLRPAHGFVHPGRSGGLCLSRRERQILQLIAEGKSSAEVGTMLFLSPKTVDTYRSRMMHKLGIGDLPNLVKFAIQHGITQLD